MGPEVKLSKFLGEGTDGAVWSTSRDSAVKVFHAQHGYINERDTYQRLSDFGVTTKIGGFWIPRMIAFDNELMVVEMDLMQRPPYIIDFAKVRIDRPPDFSEETCDDNEARGRELFEHRWPVVQSLMATLESFQIYYLDPQPYNIVFPEDK